jgi:hypothetical protein
MSERAGRRRTGRAAARPVDATTKQLLEADPASWLEYIGLPTDEPVRVIDADLSTVLAEADKVVRVGDETGRLAHIELQATYDADLPARLLHYNVLLDRRRAAPVRGVAVLPRPQADGPAMRGTVERTWQGVRYLSFEYEVMRAWHQPVERVLAGGLATP